MHILPFSATGIGSLPYLEPEPALELIFHTFPAVPHWPQLPGRGTREGMVHQFLNPLVETGLLVLQGDKVRFGTSQPDWPRRLTEFYTAALAAEEGDDQALARFAMPRDAACGFYAFTRELERRGTDGIAFLKGQLTGPLTCAFHLKDEDGKAAYYDDQLRDLVVRTLALTARWQARELARFGRPVLIFIDDLGLNVCGQSSYITVTREMVLEDLGRLVRAIGSAGALAGLHACQAVDWSIPLELDLAVVSLDAFNYSSSLLPFARELRNHLARGGMMAWGIVPTFGPGTVPSLVERLAGHWTALAERGIPPATLAQQALITPACGTGSLSPAQAEEIYGLTVEVARTLAAGPA